MLKVQSPTMTCPHCGSVSSCRRTELFSPLTREKVYQCRNIECGFAFRTHESISETLVMSSMPNPAVAIPFSQKLLESLRQQASMMQSK